MTCEAYKDRLVELSMGTLEASQRAEVLTHLKTGCSDCISFLKETGAVVDLLPFSLQPLAAPVAARDRLMKRVAGDATATPDTSNPMRIGPTTIASPVPRRFALFQALAGGAIAAGILGAIFWHTSETQRQSIALLEKQLGETRSTLNDFKTAMQARADQLALNLDRANDTILRTSQTVEMMRSPAIQMVSLQGTEAQPKIKARAYWDPEKSEVHFYAIDVATAQPGKTYQLWMLTEKGAPIPSDTFAAEQVDRGIAIALPTTADKVIGFAVTEEPVGGSKSPTMPIMMVGKIQ